MAINFPAAPSLNDTYIYGNISYKWDGISWIASNTGNTGTGVNPSFINAKDFGASGTGKDDTVAIQAAFAAAAAGNIKTIIFNGTFGVSSNLTIPDGIIITGEGVIQAVSSEVVFYLGNHSAVIGLTLQNIVLWVWPDKSDFEISGNTFTTNPGNWQYSYYIILRTYNSNSIKTNTGPQRGKISENKIIAALVNKMLVYAEACFDCIFDGNYIDYKTGFTVTGSVGGTPVNGLYTTVTINSQPYPIKNGMELVLPGTGKDYGTRLGNLTLNGSTYTLSYGSQTTLSTQSFTVMPTTYGFYINGGSNNKITNNTILGAFVAIILMPTRSAYSGPMCGNIIEGNLVDFPMEEGISIDCRGNSSTDGAQYLTTTVTNTVIGGSPSTINIADPIAAAYDVDGMVVTFLSGKLTGKSYSIIYTGGSLTSLQLGDDFSGASSYGTDVSIGDVITIEMDIRRNKILNNTIKNSGTACISIWGSGSDTIIHGNVTTTTNKTEAPSGAGKEGIAIAGLGNADAPVHSTILSANSAAIIPHNITVSDNQHIGYYGIYVWIYGTQNFKMPHIKFLGNEGGRFYADMCTDVFYTNNHHTVTNFTANNVFNPEQTITPRLFGAIGDGVNDDTTAIQTSLQYAYSLAPSIDLNSGTGWRLYTANVHFPRGRYKVATANTLFQGLQAGTFKITGEGKEGVTQIIFTGTGANNYLIYNNDIFGFTDFSDIQFTTNVNDSDSTAWKTATNRNFMYYNSTGTAQGMRFTNCKFTNFTQLFNVPTAISGAANASENTFFNCKFENFNDCAFRLINNQSVNWRFYASDAEGFTGTLFEFQKGASVLYSQGSIIPLDNSPNARIIKVPSGADQNTFGGGNFPCVTFHQTRFEMRPQSLMVEKVNESAYIKLIYDACSMGGFGIITPVVHKMFTWAGEGSIELRSCVAMENYRIAHTVNGGAERELLVIANACDIEPEFVTSSTFEVTGAPYNVGASPMFMFTNCGIGLDGTYRAYDSQFMNFGSSTYGHSGIHRHITQQKHAVCFSVEANTLAINTAAGTTYNVKLPPVRLSGIELYPISYTGQAYSSSDAIVTVKNNSGTVLATFVWNIGSPSTVKLSADCNYYVDAKNGDQLTITVASSYTPSSTAMYFHANMYLIY